MNEDRHDERSVAPDACPITSPPAKQPYRRPTLIEYGTVSELTRGAGGTRSDGQSVKKFIQL